MFFELFALKPEHARLTDRNQRRVMRRFVEKTQLADQITGAERKQCRALGFADGF